MFVGRTTEINALNELYSKQSFQMVVMYGRRRVGKTTLICEFIKDKPHIFFSAEEANEQLNLQVFSKSAYKFFSIPETTGAFANWRDAFMFIADKAQETPFILAFDEFPYAAESGKSIVSILQNIIDHNLKNSKLFLILCGSHIGFMESEVLGYKSPLFGRRTAQMNIEAFDYYDSALMLGDASPQDKINYYACIGGTPHYLAQVDTGLTFEENIIHLFFKPLGYLYAEPAMLLQQELREPSMYNSILSAVATGASRLNDIATKIGETTSKTSKYINILLNLRILNKTYPFNENPERSRRCIYSIADNCFRFWYRHVFLNKTAIVTDIGANFAKTAVFPSLSSYIGKPVFEEICTQYLQRKNKQGGLPFLALNFGTWWGADPINKTQADIDIIADNKYEKSVMLCECKWQNHSPTITDIENLIDKARLLPGYEKYYFTFFSKTAFSAEVKKFCYEGLVLVELGDLWD